MSVTPEEALTRYLEQTHATIKKHEYSLRSIDVQITLHSQVKLFLEDAHKRLRIPGLIPMVTEETVATEVVTSTSVEGTDAFGSQEEPVLPKVIRRAPEPQDKKLEYLRDVAKKAGVTLDWDLISNTKQQHLTNRYAALMSSPVNSVAFCKGEFVNTNSILALLGSSYFAEVSNLDAQGIINRRIGFLNERREAILSKITDLNLRIKLAGNPKSIFDQELSRVQANTTTDKLSGTVLRGGRKEDGQDEEDDDDEGEDGNYFHDHYKVGPDGKIYNEEGLEIVDIREPYISDDENDKGKQIKNRHDDEDDLKIKETTSLNEDEKELLALLEKHEKQEAKRKEIRRKRLEEKGNKLDYSMDLDPDNLYGSDDKDSDAEDDDEDEGEDSDEYELDYDADDVREGEDDSYGKNRSKSSGGVFKSPSHMTKKDKYIEALEEAAEDDFVKQNYPKYSDDEEPSSGGDDDDDEGDGNEESDSDDDKEYIKQRASKQTVDAAKVEDIIDVTSKIKEKRDIEKEVRFQTDTTKEERNVQNVIKEKDGSVKSILKSPKNDGSNEQGSESRIDGIGSKVMKPIVIERGEVKTYPVKDVVVERTFDNEYDAVLDAVESEDDEDSSFMIGSFPKGTKNSEGRLLRMGEQISSMYYNMQERLVNQGMISRPDDIVPDILSAVDEGFENERKQREREEEELKSRLKGASNSFAISVVADEDKKQNSNSLQDDAGAKKEQQQQQQQEGEVRRSGQPINSTVLEQGTMSAGEALSQGGFVSGEHDTTIPEVSIKVPLTDASGKPMSRFKAARLNRR